MSGSLVADLGISPEIWLVATLLICLTLFFKFGRFWSIRNLDLLLIFALTPGMMTLIGAGPTGSWWAYFWLFVGSFLWLIRCFVDLGLVRRPLLEPNLNASGLACLVIGVLVLFVIEVASLPIGPGAKRNPADSPNAQPFDPPPGERLVDDVIRRTPLTAMIHPDEAPRIILRRTLALVAQVALVVGLIGVGWRHFERPTSGLSVAACYLLLPYTRFALVDSGQLVPAALIVGAVAFHTRPLVAGALIGLAAGWMPACLALVPLWASFYRRRGFWRFTATALGVLALLNTVATLAPSFLVWARALGVPSPVAVGLWPGVEASVERSFWAGIDANYRLPVQIAYLILVVSTTLLPVQKNLGELIALSAASLVAAQFWYLEAGGTLILLYLPLVILMMFRPNLALKSPQRSRQSGPGQSSTLGPPAPQSSLGPTGRKAPTS